MCDPITAAALTIADASTYISLEQQKAEYAAGEQAFLNNQESANANARNEHAAMNLKLQQEQDAAADKLH